MDALRTTIRELRRTASEVISAPSGPLGSSPMHAMGDKCGTVGSGRSSSDHAGDDG